MALPPLRGDETWCDCEHCTYPSVLTDAIPKPGPCVNPDCLTHRASARLNGSRYRCNDSGEHSDAHPDAL